MDNTAFDLNAKHEPGQNGMPIYVFSRSCGVCEAFATLIHTIIFFYLDKLRH